MSKTVIHTKTALYTAEQIDQVLADINKSFGIVREREQQLLDLINAHAVTLNEHSGFNKIISKLALSPINAEQIDDQLSLTLAMSNMVSTLSQRVALLESRLTKSSRR